MWQSGGTIKGPSPSSNWVRCWALVQARMRRMPTLSWLLSFCCIRFSAARPDCWSSDPRDCDWHPPPELHSQHRVLVVLDGLLLVHHAGKPLQSTHRTQEIVAFVCFLVTYLVKVAPASSAPSAEASAPVRDYGKNHLTRCFDENKHDRLGASDDGRQQGVARGSTDSGRGAIAPVFLLSLWLYAVRWRGAAARGRWRSCRSWKGSSRRKGNRPAPPMPRLG